MYIYWGLATYLCACTVLPLDPATVSTRTRLVQAAEHIPLNVEQTYTIILE